MKTLTLSQKMMAVVVAFGLALIMMFGFSSGAKAADDYTVTIYLQTVDRTVSPIDIDALSPAYVDVDVDAGATLQDAVEEAIPSANWGGEYLESLTYGGTTYANVTTKYEDTSADDEDPWTHGIWEGFSWMWFNGDPTMMPSTQYAYPSTTLGGTVVNANTTITLSFEKSSFTW